MESASDSTYLDPQTGSAEDLVNRAAQSAHTLVDRVAEKAGPAVERLRSGAESVNESLHSGAQDLGELQERLTEGIRTCVRDYPLLSIGVALAAGALISRVSRH